MMLDFFLIIFFVMNDLFSYVLSVGSIDQTSIITTMQICSREKCNFMSLTSFCLALPSSMKVLLLRIANARVLRLV